MSQYFFKQLRFRTFNRLSRYHTNYHKTNYVTTNQIKNEEIFDYIIVGGGSAGCVLASRLSEDPKSKVLLLEAGPVDDHLFIYVPAAFIKLFDSPYAYNYYSEPQINANNNKIFIPQGRVLGGSSSINAMAYLRGSSYDYDNWGFKSWGFEECLKYFKKAEAQQRDKKTISNEFHGFEGPWKIGDITKPHELTQMVIKAIQEELGLPLTNDFNGSKYQEEGVGLIQVNIAKGMRQSISEAYLNESVLRRENLFIRVDNQVMKIIMEDNEAKGVEIIKGKDKGNAVRIWADKEVVLSSGVFNSPRLLMVSGIGPKGVLESKGIKCENDLPDVGNNLQDHPLFSYVKYLKKPLSLDILNQFPYNALSLSKWLWYKNNELANAAEMTGYFHSSIAKKKKELAPDLQITFIKCLYIDHGKQSQAGRYGYALGTMLLKPKSKGSVSIKSSNMLDPPIIDIGLFNDEDDFERVVDGAKTIRKVIEGRTLGQVNDKDYLIPAEKAFEDEEEFRKEIRKNAQTLYHPTSSCAMGKVVDENLRVFNTKKLRIVDGSVLPELVRANTNAPIVMIAEKASDLLKGR